VAITIYLRNIEEFPGVSKTASIDVVELIPTGTDGDERFLTVVSTSSKDIDGASIQNCYANYMKRGFSKSSGFLTGPYTISAGATKLSISIDGVASDINLATGINMSGTAVAADIEAKLQALAEDGGGNEGNLSFLAANCSYENGIFKIESGTLSDEYTGTSRSSVQVASSGTVNATIGFNVPTESYALAGRTIPEAYLAQNYVTSSGTLWLSSVTQMLANRCYVITDGNTKTDYFRASAVSSGTSSLTIPATDIGNNYTAGTGVKIQMLSIQDPDPEPKSPCEDVDSVVRWCITTIQRQINFAS
jgi:hypothetical protein